MMHSATTTRKSNVFNDMADMIFQLKKLNQEVFDNESKRISSSPDGVKTITDGFISKHPDLQQNGQQLLAHGISPETIQKLQLWLNDLPNPFYYLLEILLGLEYKIDTKDLLGSSFFRDEVSRTEFGEFESLNSNADQTGIVILPKVESIYSPQSSGESDEEESQKRMSFVASGQRGIGNELRNIYYYEKGDLRIDGCSYKAYHSILNIRGPRDKKFKHKQKVTIAVSPLTKERIDEYVRFDNLGSEAAPDRRFSVQFQNSNNRLAQRIQKDIEAAGNAEADIFILPEMYGLQDIVTNTDSLRDPLPETNVLAKAAQSLEERGKTLPSLILLPTLWYGYSNELFVRSSPERILCVQQKQFPFPALNKQDNHYYLEDLRNPDHIIHMVHIPGLGRFAFPICRDLLEQLERPYVGLMRGPLLATFLLCPSYSPSKTQFWQRASSGREYGCYTVWCNACGAYYDHVFRKETDHGYPQNGTPAEAPEDYLGFVASPLRCGEPITYFEPKCEGTCGQDGVCLFLIDLKWDDSVQSGSVQNCTHIHH